VQDKGNDRPRKQQNNFLLLNAMRATAMHSNMSFSDSSLTQPVDIPEPETPGTATMRSSATPAPTPQEPKPSTSQEPPVKGQPGAGKKKRKSGSIKASFQFNQMLTSTKGHYLLLHWLQRRLELLATFLHTADIASDFSDFTIFCRDGKND
jgi:hypothetical protein